MQNAMASGSSNICTYAHLHMYLFQTISSQRYMLSLRAWMLSNNGIVTSGIAQTMPQSLTSHVYIHARFITLIYNFNWPCMLILSLHSVIITLEEQLHLIATANLLYVTDCNYSFSQHLLHCDYVATQQLPTSQLQFGD